MYQLDLNCDMGESFGQYRLGADEQILDYITSANIACGFHAGDPAIMRKTIQKAISKGVSIGAHPGLPDLVGFGRRNMEISPDEACDMVTYQIGALQAFVKQEGGFLQHVKPHGALYNMAAQSRALADAIARAVFQIDPEIILFGLSGSELIKAGEAIGLRVASEVFADRTYQSDGSLTARRLPNACITETKLAVDQVKQMVTKGTVTTLQGEEISIVAETVCIHGDGVKAVEFAKELRTSLEAGGVTIKSMR